MLVSQPAAFKVSVKLLCAVAAVFDGTPLKAPAEAIFRLSYAAVPQLRSLAPQLCARTPHPHAFITPHVPVYIAVLRLRTREQL
jgi:hypothetical protein